MADKDPLDVVDSTESAPSAPQFDPSLAVYMPSETSAFGLSAIRKAQNGKERALSIGLPKLEDYFAPLRPGQVAGICGQTSHYKSGLLHSIEFAATQELAKYKRTHEAIIHISLEETVEEQSFLALARAGKEDPGRLAQGDVKNWDDLVKVSTTVAGIPIVRIGDSLERSEYLPRLYMSNVFRVLDYVRDTLKINMAMIALDYLQAMPIDPEMKRLDYEMQRRLQVRSDAYRTREMAVKYNCPVWCNLQAKQTLANSELAKTGKAAPSLIPGMYDIMESADVAQRFDRLLGIWLPARSYDIGTKIQLLGKELTVTPNLLFVKVNKQRGGLPAGRIFVYTVDFRSNTLLPLPGWE